MYISNIICIRRELCKYNFFHILDLGGVSGLSILFYQSSTISLYLFTKVAEVLKFFAALTKQLSYAILYHSIIIVGARVATVLQL